MENCFNLLLVRESNLDNSNGRVQIDSDGAALTPPYLEKRNLVTSAKQQFYVRQCMLSTQDTKPIH